MVRTKLSLVYLREHDIIERTQVSLTSLTKQKNNLPSIRGPSEGSETSADEYSTRRIRICQVHFCSGHIFAVVSLLVCWKSRCVCQMPIVPYVPSEDSQSAVIHGSAWKRSLEVRGVVRIGCLKTKWKEALLSSAYCNITARLDPQ